VERRLMRVLAERWSRTLMRQLESLDGRSKPPACRACACDMGAAAAEVNAMAARGVHPAVAVLVAFGRRPHLFPGSYHAMTGVLVCEALVANGLTLAANGRELAACMERVRRGARIESIEAWLLPRVHVAAADLLAVPA
jgi:hypothetical protein